MPQREELPSALAALAEHQAVELRDAHFHADAAELLDMLGQTVPGLRGGQARPLWRRVAPAVAGVAGVAALAAVFVSRPQRLGDRRAADVGGRTARIANVAGGWTGTVKYDWGDSHAENFVFEIAGRELAGTASFLGVDRGILEGRVEGVRVSFTTRTLTSLGDRRYEDTHIYKGVVEGETIRFTMMTDSGAESHVPVRFTVRRSSP
jgi:hypothetical protein